MYSGASPVWFKSDTCLCVFSNLVNNFYHIINLFIEYLIHCIWYNFGDGSWGVIFISDFCEIGSPI